MRPAGSAADGRVSMEARALAFSPRPSRVGFRPGERIVSQGDPARCLYLVRRGVVKLTSTSSQGRPAVLGLVGPGGLFGEQALLQYGHPSMDGAATWRVTPAATALTEGELSAVPVPTQWSAEDLPLILAAIAVRLCGAVASLERLLQHEALTRLVGILAELAERFGRPSERGIEIPFPLAQQDLAWMVGASRETANRSLSAVRAMGWVRRGRDLVIVDLPALRRFAQEGP
jgi:CRP/FNR family transcriptional regulator, cyclic AMP receptor protein